MYWFIVGMVVGGSIIGVGMGMFCARKIAGIEARILRERRERAQEQYRNSVR